MDATLSFTDRSSSRAVRIIESAGSWSTRSVSKTSSSTGIFLMPRNHWRSKTSHTREPRAARKLEILARLFPRPTKVLTRHTLAYLPRDYQSQRVHKVSRTGLFSEHGLDHHRSAQPLAALVY